MSAPVITLISGVPVNPVAPGTAADLTVVCADADTRDITISFTVTDNEGHVSAPTEVTVSVVDNLDTDCQIISGGGTVTKTGPLTWHFVA